MRVQFGRGTVELLQGDITRQQVDAIVNAANSRLAGGGGVDGAIHRAAGPGLKQETDRRYPDGCPTGSAVASGAGGLQARFVFHAVGPVWRGGAHGEPELLRSACRRCLDLAAENGCRSIALPAISTGVYGYPIDLAAETLLAEVRAFLEESENDMLARFVLFGEGAFGAFARVLEAMVS